MRFLRPWIRKLRLISKFMTSQTGQQIITMHIIPNISRRKGNQAMKFGQLIKYNHAQNEAVRLVQDLFLFLKKAICRIKASGRHLKTFCKTST